MEFIARLKVFWSILKQFHLVKAPSSFFLRGKSLRNLEHPDLEQQKCVYSSVKEAAGRPAVAPLQRVIALLIFTVTAEKLFELDHLGTSQNSPEREAVNV